MTDLENNSEKDLEKDLEKEMLDVVEEFKAVHDKLLKIQSSLFRLAKAKIYFEANPEYLRKLYHDKTDQQILFAVAATLNENKTE